MEPENVKNARELLLAYFQENRVLKITGVENDEQCHIVYGEIQKRFAPIIGNLRFVRVGNCVELTHTYDSKPYGERSIDILNFLYGAGTYMRVGDFRFFKPCSLNGIVVKRAHGVRELNVDKNISTFADYVAHAIFQTKSGFEFINHHGVAVEGNHFYLYDEFGNSELIPFSDYVDDECEDNSDKDDSGDTGYYAIEIEEQDNYFEIMDEQTIYGDEKQCVVVTVKTNISDKGFQQYFVEQMNNNLDVSVVCVFIS